MQPKLYFGRAHNNMKDRDSFTSQEITDASEPFDLSKYKNGIEVTLSEEPGGGKYNFSASPK